MKLRIPLVVGCLLLTTACLAGAVEPIAVEPQPIFPIIIDPIGPIIPPPILPPLGLPGLSGSLSDVTIERPVNGQSVRLKARLTILNTGTKPARHVTATVYLGPDRADSDLKLIVRLNLDTFRNHSGEIKPEAQVSIPLKHKVRKLLASTLSGAYIHVELSALDVASDESRQIVYGPLPEVR